MDFHTEKEALDWYEAQPRALTPEFLKNFPWQDVRNYELQTPFVAVLLYMRNVEKLTEVYHAQLAKSPTGQDPYIRKFMDKWAHEEDLHGDLIHRFLEEAGQPTSDAWFEKVKHEIPLGYKWRQALIHPLTKLFGEHFSAVHMTWGAMSEYSTLCGYQRLWQMAGHPILEQLLRAIAKEEAIHSYYYWSIAQMRLAGSPFRQKFTRFIIKNYWRPVGQGLRTKNETRQTVHTLFSDKTGLQDVAERINVHLQRLPGLQGSQAITERFAHYV